MTQFEVREIPKIVFERMLDVFDHGDIKECELDGVSYQIASIRDDDGSACGCVGWSRSDDTAVLKVWMQDPHEENSTEQMLCATFWIEPVTGDGRHVNRMHYDIPIAGYLGYTCAALSVIQVQMELYNLLNCLSFSNDPLFSRG